MVVVNAGLPLHAEGLEEIRSKGLGISEVILELVTLYYKLYQLSPFSINCGHCEDFAIDVCSLIDEAEWDWGEAFVNENDDPNQYGYHCIVRYQGKFYDSEHPDGVEDFRQISAFQENK